MDVINLNRYSITRYEQIVSMIYQTINEQLIYPIKTRI